MQLLITVGHKAFYMSNMLCNNITVLLVTSKNQVMLYHSSEELGLAWQKLAIR